MKLSCILMAAGAGARFGPNKLMAELEGKSLIVRALDAVPAEKFDSVAVVAKDETILSMARARGFTPIYNGETEKGLSHTVALGIGACPEAEALMFMVADQPLLKRESVAAEVSFYLEDPEHIAAMGYGERRGNPAIFPKRFFENLLSLKGDVGGSAVIKKYDNELRLYQVENEFELWDTDTREALERFRENG